MATPCLGSLRTLAGKRVLSADSGLATVGGAALYGIVRAAQAQFEGGPPRINEMRIYALVTRHGGGWGSGWLNRGLVFFSSRQPQQ